MSICILFPVYIIVSCFSDPIWVKYDVGTRIHNIIYNCTRRFLLHMFLLIHHPYPPSLQRLILSLRLIIFILVSLIFIRCSKTTAPGHTKNANTYIVHALMQTVPLLSKHCNKSNGVFLKKKEKVKKKKTKKKFDKLCDW